MFEGAVVRETQDECDGETKFCYLLEIKFVFDEVALGYISIYILGLYERWVSGGLKFLTKHYDDKIRPYVFGGISKSTNDARTEIRRIQR